MHVGAYINILVLARYACALEATSKDVSSKLISKEGSILSTLMNKSADNVETGEENLKNKKDKLDPSLETQMEKQQTNPKVAESSPSPQKSKSDRKSTGLAPDLSDGYDKESPTHIIRLSESVQVIRDTQDDVSSKPPSVIRDDGFDPVHAKKKSVLSDLATSALESRDSGEDRKELHETSTNLI